MRSHAIAKKLESQSSVLHRRSSSDRWTQPTTKPRERPTSDASREGEIGVISISRNTNHVIWKRTPAQHARRVDAETIDSHCCFVSRAKLPPNTAVWALTVLVVLVPGRQDPGSASRARCSYLHTDSVECDERFDGSPGFSSWGQPWGKMGKGSARRGLLSFSWSTTIASGARESTLGVVR